MVKNMKYTRSVYVYVLKSYKNYYIEKLYSFV